MWWTTMKKIQREKYKKNLEEKFQFLSLCSLHCCCLFVCVSLSRAGALYYAIALVFSLYNKQRFQMNGGVFRYL